MVSDALATMLDNAKTAGEIKGLVPNLIEGGLTHLQYADDTVIFLELDDTTVTNAKFLLYCFENMSGLRINYQKSEIFVMGASKVDKKEWLTVFTCNIGKMPIKYLGVMVSANHLTVVELMFVSQKVERRLPTWQCANLPSGGNQS